MKKVLSFVLVLSMILGSFGMAFAAPATDVADTKYEDAVNMLTELDVISGYTDGTFKPGKEVTRAEMATFIIKALNLDEYATAGSSFADMEGHWADGFVGYAASLQIVAGRTATTFDPDALVTYDEAITMMVQALGYQGKYMVGGFHGAFVNKAKALGLLDGVVAGKANAVRGDIALMIYNALGENFVRYDVNGYEQPVADTMMKRLTGATTTFGGVVAGNEEALIAIKEYQGAEVKGLKNSDGKIVAIEEVVSIFLEGDINASGTALTLADDTEYKLDRVSTSNAAYFVNGVKNASNKNATQLTDTAVKMAVEVSGKYVTKVYSYAVWTPTATFKWAEADAEALDKDVPKLKNVAFVMTDDDEIDTKEFVLEGAASLDAIPEDAIVTYYVADLDGVSGNEIAKVQVSTEVVEGKVTEVTKAGKLVIGGKEYKKAVYADNYAVENITDGLGAEGKFFLNAAGNIAYTDTTAKAADDYAMVLLAADNDNKSYDAEDNFKIKLLTADGAKVFSVTKKCFNEKASDSAVFTKGAFVAYALDSDGAVKDIVAKNASMAGFGSYKLTAKGYLNNYKVSDNVVVFQPDGEGSYEVADMDAVPVDEALTKTNYLLNDDKEVVVIYTEDQDKEDGIYGMVVTYSEVENADEKAVYKVTLAIDGAVKEPVLTKDGSAADAESVFKNNTSLCAFEYEGGELKAVKTTATAVNAGTIEKIQDGNIAFTTSGAFDAVANDVVVYAVDKDGDVTVSSFTALTKGDYVELYQLDKTADDKDGADVIIYREK